jgi:hypothetical protein
LSLLINRRVPEPAERLLDLLELGSHALAPRPAPELEAGAIPLAGAVVGEPQEVEHFRLALAPSHPAFPRVAEGKELYPLPTNHRVGDRASGEKRLSRGRRNRCQPLRSRH